MAETANKQSPEMRYLLGTLSEDEQIRLEEAFFADDSKFEAVEIAEDALIDAYVRDELSAGERQQFQSKLRTSPRLVERVRFAETLAEKTSKLVAQENVAKVPTVPLTPTKVRWSERWANLQLAPRLAYVACALLFVALATTLVRVRSESNRIATERAALQQQNDELLKQLNEQRTRTEQLAAEFQRLQDQSTGVKLTEKEQLPAKQNESVDRQPLLSSLATIFLTPGTLRSGGGPQEFLIQPGATTAQLQLALGETDYRAFNAVITASEKVIRRKNRVKPTVGKSGPQLLLSVPARLLPPDDYVVHLDGVTAGGQVETFNDYQFRVPNK